MGASYLGGGTLFCLGRGSIIWEGVYQYAELFSLTSPPVPWWGLSRTFAHTECLRTTPTPLYNTLPCPFLDPVGRGALFSFTQVVFDTGARGQRRKGGGNSEIGVQRDHGSPPTLFKIYPKTRCLASAAPKFATAGFLYLAIKCIAVRHRMGIHRTLFRRVFNPPHRRD